MEIWRFNIPSVHLRSSNRLVGWDLVELVESQIMSAAALKFSVLEADVLTG